MFKSANDCKLILLFTSNALNSLMFNIYSIVLVSIRIQVARSLSFLSTGMPADIAEKVKVVKEDQVVTRDGNTLQMTHHKLVVNETVEENQTDGSIVKVGK